MDHSILRPFDDTSHPSSDDVELPSKTMRWYERRKKTLLWILAITTGIALSREFGFINLEWLAIKLSGRIDIKSSTIYWEDGIKRYTSNDNRVETTTTTQTYKFGFDFPRDTDPEIDASIKKSLAEAKYIDVFQVKSEVSGTYLFPIFKNGRCEYSVEFGAKAVSGKYYNGKLTGAMDFDVRGICSRRKLRELLSKQISNEIVKAIESNISE